MAVCDGRRRDSSEERTGGLELSSLRVVVDDDDAGEVAVQAREVLDVLAFPLKSLDILKHLVVHSFYIEFLPEVNLLSEPPLLVSSVKILPVVFQILVIDLQILLLSFVRHHLLSLRHELNCVIVFQCQHP